MRSFGVISLIILSCTLFSASAPVDVLSRGAVDASAKGSSSAAANVDANLEISRILDTLNVKLADAGNRLSQLKDAPANATTPAGAATSPLGLAPILGEVSTLLGTVVSIVNGLVGGLAGILRREPLASRAGITQVPDGQVLSRLFDVVTTYNKFLSQVATLPGNQAPGATSAISSQFATFMSLMFNAFPGLRNIVSAGIGGLDPSNLTALLSASGI